ncbi:uncharacterized protein LOC139929404 [Centroberyx gerrardi]|uniref:uncharacterized protein n=1 Tax=Centroberyx gerrardi TaxID=166262 RepID=UPI003AAA24FE
MKKQGKGEATTTIHLSSPTESSSVQVYDDCQRVAYNKMHPGNVRTMENGSHAMRDGLQQVAGRDGRGKSSSAADADGLKDQSALRDSMWMMDSSSQAYSGPEDNSTDAHETLTETSTLTFVDAHTIDESGESHSLQGLGAGLVYIKEFVLIDDDDDGDMSLREKTVTDMSVMDGNAADLVCGRLLSISSGSLSECKGESPGPEAPPPEEAEPPTQKQRCCFCTIL